MASQNLQIEQDSSPRPPDCTFQSASTLWLAREDPREELHDFAEGLDSNTLSVLCEIISSKFVRQGIKGEKNELIGPSSLAQEDAFQGHLNSL